MGSNEQQIDAILDKIEKENSIDALSQGLNILAKLVQNIITNPFDVKYRQVKTSNNTIKTKIMNLKNIQLLLQKLGYTRENQEIYTLKDEQLGDFLEGSPAIDYRRRLVSAKLTSQAAYEKEIEVIKCHKAQQRQAAKRNQQTKRLKEKCQMDKLQRKHMKVDQTKSNQLAFGSKANTFKDIGIDLCAQKKGG